MVKYAEQFFTSLGYQPLPPAFWERSLFTNPPTARSSATRARGAGTLPRTSASRCASQINAEDFQVVHHELGHNYYGLLYAKQPYLYRDGAIDAFHEAVGDVDRALRDARIPETDRPDRPGSVGEGAISNISSIPRSRKSRSCRSALVIDQWRWKVFSGEIAPADYNKAWWELRNKYQGVAAPLARTEVDFDPGAKYHVPANTPYTRYFLAYILQFQFHRALCKEAGFTGPLHRCSIYGNKAAGAKLAKMLAMGSQPPVARGAGRVERRIEDGCDGDSRLLRAAENVAGRAEPQREARVEPRNEAHRCLQPPRSLIAAAAPFQAFRFQFQFRFRIRVRSAPSCREPTLSTTRRSRAAKKAFPSATAGWARSSGRRPSALKFQINRVDIQPINKDTRSFFERNTDYMGGAGFVDLELAGAGDDVFTADGTSQRLSVYEGMLDVEGGRRHRAAARLARARRDRDRDRRSTRGAGTDSGQPADAALGLAVFRRRDGEDDRRPRRHRSHARAHGAHRRSPRETAAFC